jgi:hypothetical protein
MTLISRVIHRTVLTTLAVCAFFVGVAGCPGDKLTITFSWPGNSLVHIANSGVPSAALNSGISGWNTMNAVYSCFGPTFIVDNNVGGEQINMSFTTLPANPKTGAVQRGVTHLESAIFILGRDANHNGVCEPNELRPLSEVLSAIDLAYKESRRVDQYGNEFRYRSRVFDVNGVQGGRWAWDVFVKVQL